jgi:serine/threonine protein kinase
LIGQRFGNYRAVSLLGEGGMGSVYLAEHPEIGRKVAVKVLRTEYNRDTQLLARFLNEARAANAIRHPNIIEILDSGTTAEGMPYLVMELLEGEVLSARLRRLGRLPLGSALELCYQMASALGAAHRKGIVHRDLKPDNLFVVPEETDASRERIKVLDFGIAKLQTQPHGDSVKTRTGALMGTPVYMSPEQCLGTKELDHRTDIYSLGVILFEMLCGRPPFVSTGFGELVNMHLNTLPPAPRAIAPSIPPGVEMLIMRMLAKNPEARPSSMAEVQGEIKQAVSGIDVKGTSKPDFPNGTLRGGTAVAATSMAAAPAPPPTQPFPLPSTTFSSWGTGERLDPLRAPRRRPLVAILVIGAAAVGAVFVVRPYLSGKATPTVAEPAPVPPPTPAAPAPKLPVHIVIDSQPAAARVVRVSDGVLLGTTPLRQELAAGGPALELRLEKEGFEPATRSIPLDGDHHELVRLAASPPPNVKSTPAPRPHKPRPRPPVPEEPAKL